MLGITSFIIKCIGTIGSIKGWMLRILPAPIGNWIAHHLARLTHVLPARLYLLYYPFINELLRQLYFRRRCTVEMVHQITPGVMMALNLAEKTQRLIYLGRPYEPSLTRYVLKTLLPGDVFMDVGAHQGYYSLLAARLVEQSGHVIAFEALSKNAQRIAENLKRNQFDSRVTVFQKAVGDYEGTVTMYINPLNDGGGTLSNLATYSDNETHVSKATVESEYPAGSLEESVEMVRIDAVIESLQGIEKTKLIRIDVEGNEINALAGLSGMLTQNIRPTIVCEVGSFGTEHRRWLAAHRYEVYTLNEVGLPQQILLPNDGAHGNYVFQPLT